MNFNRSSQAFPLVELLAVIAVVGILAAILVPAISDIRERARKASSTFNLHQIFPIPCRIPNPTF